MESHKIRDTEITAVAEELKVTPSMIFVNFLNFVFFVLLSPFRVRYCPVQRKFERKTKAVQQIVVAFIHTLILLSMIQKVLGSASYEKKSRFQSFSALTFVGLRELHILSVVYVLWFRQQEIFDFLNSFDQLSNYLIKNQLMSTSKQLVRITAILIPLCMFLLGACHTISAVIDEQALKNTSAVENLSENDICFSGNRSLMENLWTTFWQIFYGVLISMTWFSRGILMSVTASVWIFTSSFVGQVQKLERDVNALVKVLDALESFAVLFEHAGKAFGLLFFTECFGFAPSLALQASYAINEFLTAKARLFSSLVLLFSILFLAGSVNSQIKSIQCWVHKSLTTARHQSLYCIGLHLRVNSLIQQINANEFSFSGNLFTITYGFIGSIGGLLLTYTIIVAEQDNGGKIY